jgi:hypothetical protein
VQKESPQEHVVAGSASRKIGGGTGEEGSEKSAAAAQEPGVAGVLGPAGSAAKPGMARHVPTSRRKRAARRTGMRCFILGSPFLIKVLRDRKKGHPPLQRPARLKRCPPIGRRLNKDSAA